MTIVRTIRNRVPSAVTQSVGSLSFPGGASTSDSGTVRIARTGAMDFNTATIEGWITVSATDSDNGQEVAAGANYNGTNCNILLDADSVNTRGMILGLSAGMLLMSVNAASERTIIGSTDTRDAVRRHFYFHRNGTTGLMEIGLAGVREATFSGPTGLVTYDGDAPETDAFHYLCKEKLNATFGCDCLLSELRVRSDHPYSGATYTVPTTPFETDANTIAIYHMDEQTGTTMGDSSGNGFDGELLGNPVPTWNSASPFP